MSGVSRFTRETRGCKRPSDTIKKVELLNDLPFSEGDTTELDTLIQLHINDIKALYSE